MQGQRSSMGSMPDTISFDLNPTATDANIDQSILWNNNIQNYGNNTIPEFITSTTNNGSTYLNSSSQAQNLNGWIMGESSSSNTQNYSIRNEQKSEDAPVNGMDLNQNSNQSHQSPYSPLFMQNSGNNSYPQALNLGLESGENSDNLRQLTPSSASGGYFGEEIYSSEGRRLKRKAIEGHIGQSSSSGNPSEWNNVPGWYNAHFGSNTTNTTSLENPLRASPSEASLPLTLSPNVENSRRSQRARISSSPQQNPSPTIFSNGNISGVSNVLTYPQSSRLVSLSNFSGPRTPQPRRVSRGSSSRGGYSLSFGERIATPNEESESNILQRNILENPIFVPTDEARSSSQFPPDWGMSGNLNINGNINRNSHPLQGPSGISHRTPRNLRRLSDYARRSLLSSPVLESGGQNGNLPVQGGSSSLQTGASSGAGGNYGDRLARLRSALLFERQLDGSFGGANASRTATGGAEGRSRLVSEIRNVLDLMRRGEGLRLEDMVILDQSGFFGMADIHDRHRDMRLDVDNMSYEELLALEERIGNVNTGLSQEIILKSLKQRKFFSIAMGAQSELEPCCICREEYNDGEDIGTVECGHEFHSGCIKQWLMLKNSCPICKTTALNK